MEYSKEGIYLNLMGVVIGFYGSFLWLIFNIDIGLEVCLWYNFIIFFKISSS